jgi:phosphoglycolate phosphatase-like HAD superfamily hydrolase
MHLIIFDIDGTLVQSSALDGAIYAKAIREVLGIVVDDTWRSYKNRTHSGILSQVLTECAPENEHSELSKRVERQFTELFQDHIMREGLMAVPGAVELVHRLKSDERVAVALATGGWKQTAEMKLDAVDLDYRDLPFVSSSDAHSKVEILKFAAQKAERGSHAFVRTTYVGDTSADQEASAQLDYAFVGVGNEVEHAVRFDDLRDHRRVLLSLGVGVSA